MRDASDASNALFAAIEETGNTETVKQFLTQRPDVASIIDAPNIFGNTLLIVAAYSGLTEIARLLIEHRAGVSTKSFLGETPLGEASFYGKTDIAKLLIEHRADTNEANKGGVTPLHSASGCGFFPLVSLLIANNANVNAADRFNTTPLHAAACHGHAGITKLLIENKATRNALSFIANKPEVFTPLDEAIRTAANKDTTRQLLNLGCGTFKQQNATKIEESFKDSEAPETPVKMVPHPKDNKLFCSASYLARNDAAFTLLGILQKRRKATFRTDGTITPGVQQDTARIIARMAFSSSPDSFAALVQEQRNDAGRVL